MKQRRADDGFTLIEILVVVIIVVALAGMVLPRVVFRAEEAKREIARGGIAGISTALKVYYIDNQRYPSTDEGLSALMTRPASASNWKGPYLEKSPNDPWKRPYQYRHPGSKDPRGFDVWSLGPDPNDDSDNINSWDE